MASLSDLLTPDQLQSLLHLKDKLPEDNVTPSKDSLSDLTEDPSVQADQPPSKTDQINKDVNDYLTVANTGYYPGEKPADTSPTPVDTTGMDMSTPSNYALAKGVANDDEQQPSYGGGLMDWLSKNLTPGGALAQKDDVNLTEPKLGADLNGDDPSLGVNTDLASTALNPGAGGAGKANANDDSVSNAGNVPNQPSLSLAQKLARAKSTTSNIPGAPSQSSPDNTPTQNDSIGSLLKSIYGNGLDDKALVAAQQQRNEIEKAAMMQKAADLFASGMSRGATGSNDEVADALMKSAGSGVQNIMERRQAIGQNMEAGLKASDLMDLQQMRNPNSNISNAYRNMALQLNPKLANDPRFQQMSAEGIKNTLPMVDMSIRMQMVKAQRDYTNAMREQMFNYRVGQDSAKAKADMAGKINQMMQRGTPMQAQTGILAADKIMDLFNNKPDPSSWDSNEVAMFRTEAAKMAHGGVPNEYDQRVLLSPTVSAMIAKTAGTVTGKSIGTGQGEQIKALIPYIQNVKQTSSQFLKDNVYTPIMTGYNRRVTPDDMQDYKSSLPGYIFPENGNGKPQKMPVYPDQQMSNAGKIKVSDGKTSYLIDPSDLPHAQQDNFKQVP